MVQAIKEKGESALRYWLWWKAAFDSAHTDACSGWKSAWVVPFTWKYKHTFDVI